MIDVATRQRSRRLYAQGPDRLAFVFAQRQAACFCRGILQRPDVDDRRSDCRLGEGRHGTASPTLSDADITFTAWQSENDILIAGIRSLETVLALCDAKTGRTRILWSGLDTTLGGERYFPFVSPGTAPGDCAVTMEGFFTPQTLAVFRGGEMTNRRASWPGWRRRDARRPRPRRGATWKAKDGWDIHGWLLQPRWRQRPARRHRRCSRRPGLVLAPRVASGAIRSMSLCCAAGYAIFQPNPRGSTGRGQDFARAVAGDMGGADAQDILSGLDRLVAEGIVDPKRIGITGVSYGGIMSAWIITQDTRFAAAVVVSPVTDYVSEQLTSHIPGFLRKFPAGQIHQSGRRIFQAQRDHVCRPGEDPDPQYLRRA